LNAETALYCHAHGFTDPALIRHNTAYFDEVERRCREALSEGRLRSKGEPAGDPVASLGWPLEEALPPGVSITDLPHLEFYREGHVRAIRAMLRWLEEGIPEHG
jgi:hypothetical protein